MNFCKLLDFTKIVIREHETLHSSCISLQQHYRHCETVNIKKNTHKFSCMSACIPCIDRENLWQYKAKMYIYSLTLWHLN